MRSSSRPAKIGNNKWVYLYASVPSLEGPCGAGEGAMLWPLLSCSSAMSMNPTIDRIAKDDPMELISNLKSGFGDQISIKKGLFFRRLWEFNQSSIGGAGLNDFCSGWGLVRV
ncbi:hypothetical protein SAY87_007100 [Trapa incisa]|uniref:Uncharacterized protein n=1 Tax=Trapa incisa TaxID=236973 RepID=A0AAN7JXE2_9MYRT|nr:hypothetical protein SAY87_007100 [Trapa incisa]